MEILRRGGQIADLDIVIGAGLEKAFEPCAGMFRPLSFLSVREQQHYAAWLLPFRFGGNDKLIDEHLRAVGEIAKLRFPNAKHSRIIEGVTVIEPEHSGLRKRTVVNANAGLLLRQMHERDVGLAGFGVVKNRVPRAKGAA